MINNLFAIGWSKASWNKEPPAPKVPTEVIQKTVDKYQEALDLLTEIIGSAVKFVKFYRTLFFIEVMRSVAIIGIGMARFASCPSFKKFRLGS